MEVSSTRLSENLTAEIYESKDELNERVVILHNSVVEEFVMSPLDALALMEFLLKNAAEIKSLM